MAMKSLNTTTSSASGWAEVCPAGVTQAAALAMTPCCTRSSSIPGVMLVSPRKDVGGSFIRSPFEAIAGEGVAG